MHLQELRGRAVGVRQRLQQLVVRREAPLRPEARAAVVLARGQRHEPEARAGRRSSRPGRRSPRRWRPRARGRPAPAPGWRRAALLGGLAGLHHAVLLLRRRGSPKASRSTSPSRERPATRPAGAVHVLGHRQRGVGVEERAHLVADDVLPVVGARLARLPRPRRCAAPCRRRARPRAPSAAAPGSAPSARGRPTSRMRSTSRAAAASSKPVSTSSTPKRPRASAVATGQARLYCISSVVRGRRHERPSAAANVRTSIAAIARGVEARRRAAAARRRCRAATSGSTDTA